MIILFCYFKYYFALFIYCLKNPHPHPIYLYELLSHFCFFLFFHVLMHVCLIIIHSFSQSQSQQLLAQSQCPHSDSQTLRRVPSQSLGFPSHNHQGHEGSLAHILSH